MFSLFLFFFVGGGFVLWVCGVVKGRVLMCYVCAIERGRFLQEDKEA